MLGQQSMRVFVLRQGRLSHSSRLSRWADTTKGQARRVVERLRCSAKECGYFCKLMRQKL